MTMKKTRVKEIGLLVERQAEAQEKDLQDLVAVATEVVAED